MYYNGSKLLSLRKLLKMLEKAIQIALNAHYGQTDKAGKSYIFHLLRVMHKGKTETEKICGILHDLIEDTEWTFDELKKEGFSDEILQVLDCLTKRENENYDDFIQRVAQNSTAIRVKINDLEDNMDITRLSQITEKDLERLNKYLKAYYYLKTLI